jgi:ATP-dependent protease ClpP protease subunit
MKSKFWKLKNSVEGSGTEIYIEGAISSEEWWGDEATPSQLREELKAISGNKITVVINSGGGDVWAGLAMYNALRELEAEVVVRVDGLAASIASVIAMAGDKVIMSPGSMMMIHKASAWAGGNSDDLEKVIEMLETVEQSIVPIYADRTGLSREEVQEMMNAETWLSAEDAVEKGFADEVAKKAVQEVPTNSFSGVLALSMSATQASTKVALEHQDAAEEVVEAVKEEDVSQNPEQTEDVVPAKTDDGGEAEKPTEVEVEDENPEKVEEEPEVEQVVEATPENNSTKDKDIKMSKQEEIAASQVLEPTNQAPVNALAKPDMKAYLSSDEAMNEFARVLEANPGEKGGESSMKVRNSWKKHLETKMGVTNPEIFLPTPLVQAIQNAFEDGGEIWNRVAKVGADVWNAAWDTENDVNDNNGRARGYNRADEPEKQEQVLTFDDRILRAQFVYKYITLNKEDIKEQRSTGALVTYVLSELPQRIVREVERAIVLGDGRASDDDFKIKEGDPRGFYPILGDAAANNFFAGEVDVVGDEADAEIVALAIDDIETPGEVVLIAKKGYATRARFAKDSNGDYIFPIGTKATDILGVNTIIEPDWFTDANSPDYDGVVVVLSGYKVVGDTTIEGFSNFILKTNKQEYLQEIWAGGGLSTKKAAIAIPAAGSS